ncbi:hypothetical protein MCOR31_011205 [Pyricularia oryzae]|nr:hypothetical protein MCOR31_011205 [Pyricularia oryzae]
MYNHYYDRKLKSYAKLPQSNHYVWAGPTKDLTHQQIHEIGEEWCRNYPTYNFFCNNCHHFVYDLYKEIKQ